MSMTCDEARRRLGVDGLEQAIRDAVVRVRDIATVTQGTNPRTVFGRVRRGTTTIPGGGYADEKVVKAVRQIAAGIPGGPADVVAVEVVRRAFLQAGSFPSSPALSEPVLPEAEERIPPDVHIPSATTPKPDASRPTRSQPGSNHRLPPSRAACDEEAIRIELDRCLDELYPDPGDRQACREGVFGQTFDRLTEYAGLLRLEPHDEGWELQRRCRARLAIAAELTMFEVSDHSPRLASMLMPHINRLLDLINAEQVCSGLDPQAIIERSFDH